MNIKLHLINNDITCPVCGGRLVNFFGSNRLHCENCNYEKIMYK